MEGRSNNIDSRTRRHDWEPNMPKVLRWMLFALGIAGFGFALWLSYSGYLEQAIGVAGLSMAATYWARSDT